MDIFSQNKLLIRLILFLVVLNLGSITFFSIKSFRPENKPELEGKDKQKKELSQILKSELNLSNQQAIKFNEIRKLNAAKKIQFKQIIDQDKDLLNKELFKKNYDNQKALALAYKIGNNELNIELSKIEQSKQLKAICNPKQLEKFEELMQEIRDYLKPNDRPRRP
ncbi:MAG: hypothetical protein H7174_14135 [Flavobacterium sp.]|nr:hypothetical protein [Flavobacterium sp.]